MPAPDLLQELAAIGPRPAGSAGAHAAADAIADAFSRLGLDVASQPFQFLRYVPEPVSLRVDGAEWDARPCLYAPSTPADGVTGRLGPVGPHVMLPGTFEGSTFAVEDAGGHVLARILTNPLGPPAAFMSTYAHALAPPAVYVSRDDGRRLQEREGASVTLRTAARFLPGTPERNIVARLPGDSERTIVIGAHYDSAWDAPGVVDNATGVEGVRRVAAVLAARDRRTCSILFCAFAAEEVGLLGSRWFVTEAKMRGQLDRIAGVVNLDCIGHGEQLQVWADPPELRARIVEVARTRGLARRYDLVGRPAGPGSDHFPFAAEGIPAVGIMHFPYPEYHADERLELVDPQRLDDSVALAIDTVDELMERQP